MIKQALLSPHVVALLENHVFLFIIVRIIKKTMSPTLILVLPFHVKRTNKRAKVDHDAA